MFISFVKQLQLLLCSRWFQQLLIT